MTLWRLSAEIAIGPPAAVGGPSTDPVLLFGGATRRLYPSWRIGSITPSVCESSLVTKTRPRASMPATSEVQQQSADDLRSTHDRVCAWPPTTTLTGAT